YIRFLRSLERFPGEICGLTIMRGEKPIPKGKRVDTALCHISQVCRISGGFSELCVLHPYVFAVHPEARKRFLAGCGFGLRYLIVVMDGDMLYSAGMYVYL